MFEALLILRGGAPRGCSCGAFTDGRSKKTGPVISSATAAVATHCRGLNDYQYSGLIFQF